MAPSLVTVRIPTPLRECCGGASRISLAAPSPRAVLEELEARHPELYRSVCDETGRLRRHISLFVNSTYVRDGDGLDAALSPGDVVSIFPAVSGG